MEKLIVVSRETQRFNCYHSFHQSVCVLHPTKDSIVVSLNRSFASLCPAERRYRMEREVWKRYPPPRKYNKLYILQSLFFVRFNHFQPVVSPLECNGCSQARYRPTPCPNGCATCTQVLLHLDPGRPNAGKGVGYDVEFYDLLLALTTGRKLGLHYNPSFPLRQSVCWLANANAYNSWMLVLVFGEESCNYCLLPP